MKQKIALFIFILITLFVNGSLPRSMMRKEWEEEHLAYIATKII